MTGFTSMIDKMRDTANRMADTSFADAETLAKLPNMSTEELDELKFGVIRVSSEGVIESYNRYESQIGGFAPREVIGKNFFTQIAVCTNNDIFFGSYQTGIEEGDLNMMFQYTFTYKIAPTNVRVHLYTHPESKTHWVLVQKK